MKYIITQNGEIIIGNVGHWDLWEGVAKKGFNDIISAGHCRLKNGHIVVWGKSATFDILCRQEDARIIEDLLNN